MGRMTNGPRSSVSRFAILWVIGFGVVTLTLGVMTAFRGTESPLERWLWAWAPQVDSWAMTVLALALAVLGAVPSISSGWVRLFEALDRALDRRGLAAALTVAWLLMAWLLRSMNTELGDADMLFQHLIYDAHVYGFNTYPDEYLSRILGSRFYLLAHESFGVSFAHAWAALSILWGLAFVSAVRRLASTWFPGRSAARGLTLGLFFCAGLTQHFFGYLELYAGATVLIVLTAIAFYRTSGGQAKVLFPAMLVGLTIACNSFATCLLPALTVLAWLSARAEWRTRVARVALALAVAALPLLLTWAWLQLQGYDVQDHHLTKSHAVRGRFIFSVTPDDPHYLYGPLDPRHFLDIVNALVLSGVPGLGALIAALLLGRRRLPWRSHAAAVYGLASAGLIGFICVVNPDLGPVADWDLLSFGGLGVTLAGAFLLPFALPDDNQLRRVGGALLAVGLGITVPFVLQNAHTLGPDYERIDEAPEPWMKELGTQLGAQSVHEVAHLGRAERRLGRGFRILMDEAPELDIRDDEPSAARRIAEHYRDRPLPAAAGPDLEAARKSYEEASRLNPDNVQTHRRLLGLLQLLKAGPADVRPHLEAILRIEPDASDRAILEATLSSLPERAR